MMNFHYINENEIISYYFVNLDLVVLLFISLFNILERYKMALYNKWCSIQIHYYHPPPFIREVF